MYLIIYFCSKIKEINDTFGSHLNIDLQQRSVEFSQLFGSFNNLRESLLEKMPAMTISKINGANGDVELESSTEKLVLKNNNNNTSKSNTDALLDLLAGDDIIMSTPTATVSTTSAPAASNDLLDLLGGIDISTPSVSIVSQNNNNNLSSPITMSIFDDNENTKIPTDGSIFNMNGGSAQVSSENYDLGLDFLSSPTTTTSAKIITVFDKNDLLITFANLKQTEGIQVMMTTTNNSLDTLEQYLFQVNLNFFKVF